MAMGADHHRTRVCSKNARDPCVDLEIHDAFRLLCRAWSTNSMRIADIILLEALTRIATISSRAISQRRSVWQLQPRSSLFNDQSTAHRIPT